MRLTAEDRLELQILDAGLPEPEREYRFAPPRRWRADFAWPKRRLIVEVNGGTWSPRGAKKCPVCGRLPRSGHTSARGLERDYEKQNEAVLAGWRYLEVTPKMVDDGRALEWVRRALEVDST